MPNETTDKYASEKLPKIAKLAEDLALAISEYRVNALEDYTLCNQEVYNATDLTLEDVRSVAQFLANF